MSEPPEEEFVSEPEEEYEESLRGYEPSPEELARMEARHRDKCIDEVYHNIMFNDLIAGSLGSGCKKSIFDDISRETGVSFIHEFPVGDCADDDIVSLNRLMEATGVGDFGERFAARAATRIGTGNAARFLMERLPTSQEVERPLVNLCKSNYQVCIGADVAGTLRRMGKDELAREIDLITGKSLGGFFPEID